MAYEYLSVGTQRLTAQGFVGSTNPSYAIRIYHITVVTSASNSSVILSSVTGNTTATDVATPYFFVPANTSGTTYFVGEVDLHYGRLFDIASSNVLLNTCSAFAYALVEYVVLKK